MVDYLNELREGCLEAYTGIIQGVKGDPNEGISGKCSHTIVPHLTILRFSLLTEREGHSGRISPSVSLVWTEQSQPVINAHGYCGKIQPRILANHSTHLYKI